MAEENRKRDAAVAPPSLWGASKRPAAPAEDLKILSALQGPGAEPKRRSGSAVAVAAVCAVAAGVSAVLWWGASSRAAAPMAMATSEVPVAKAEAVPLQAAPAQAPAASAAVIENVPAEPVVAAASAAAPASPVAQPLAALAAEPVASAASVPPARRAAKAHAAPHKPATAHASAQKKPEPPKQAAKDPDVDLLEAMVAHVRGTKAAASKRSAAAPADPAKP
jgi:ribonuclease E